MTELHSYSQIFNVGHKALDNFWKGKVVVQEKVDGSQFSFANVSGQFVARSKGAAIHAPERMFRMAFEHAKDRVHLLPMGYVFRAEAVTSPKHNSLHYSRCAKGGIVLYDVDAGQQDYLCQGVVKELAETLEVDYAPVFDVLDHKPTSFEPYLHRESVLGGTEVEGVVLKNYGLFGLDGKVVMAKAVRPEFREVNAKEWKQSNASPIDTLIDAYRTEARWRKAIQRLNELGALVNAPNDIGALINEIQQDVLFECEDEIKEKLFSMYWGTISRGIIRGFPEFYKAKLLEDA